MKKQEIHLKGMRFEKNHLNTAWNQRLSGTPKGGGDYSDRANF
jgi:hypothetical protein